jgi:hypothetical protein
MSNEEIIESETGREEADPWRPMYYLAVANTGRGIEPFDEYGAELIDVQISRHEAEILCRYWFERKSWTEEEWRIYGQFNKQGMYEAFFASGRMGEFEPHVSGPFRAELKAEAERRDEEVRKARLAYIARCASDARGNDPEDLD